VRALYRNQVANTTRKKKKKKKKKKKIRDGPSAQT
jgi:hypothetical protein